jgi:hypothetical protein
MKLFEECPSCGGPITVTECYCPNCQLTMRGEFTPSQFSALSNDQLTFTREFLRARGNLSELEKVLGVSYPTIRNKLDEINLTLDRSEAISTAGPARGEVSPSESAGSPETARQEILRKVASGELTAAEGVRRLRAAQGGK